MVRMKSEWFCLNVRFITKNTCDALPLCVFRVFAFLTVVVLYLICHTLLVLALEWYCKVGNTVRYLFLIDHYLVVVVCLFVSFFFFSFLFVFVVVVVVVYLLF